jgi:hypothetical protein
MGYERPVPAPGGTGEAAPACERLVIGRRRQRRLDLRLAQGSLLQLPTRACAVGVFENVALGGPAADLDAALGGVISSLARRRMITGRAGEVFLFPAARHALRADWIIFAGLGAFDRFSHESQQLAAEQVVRTLAHTHIEEFAAVLPGAGSGRPMAECAENLLAGVLRGLSDADPEQRFRSITLCEIDPARFQELRREVYRLAGSPLLADLELTLDELLLPPPPVRGAVPPAPVYLLVRREPEENALPVLRVSLLGAGRKAVVVTGLQAYAPAAFADLLATVGRPGLRLEALPALGDRLAQLALPPEILAVLPGFCDRHLVVVHDAFSSRFPWEILRINGLFPAAEAGLSRQYAADHLPVARYLEQRRHRPVLDILLAVNPTQDLDGAEQEGARLRELFGAHPSISLQELRGAAATRPALLEAFRSGRYDVIHYAGHAFFDPENPGRSGLLCHGREVLGGEDLRDLGSLPSLIFFNACESGRLRRGSQRPGAKGPEGTGAAESFLRGGLANYLGTYWPVGDVAAGFFAAAFYRAVVAGKTLGAALLAGRRAVRDEARSPDWTNYLHYGSCDVVLKEP